jgi:hypothetical protein
MRESPPVIGGSHQCEDGASITTILDSLSALISASPPAGVPLTDHIIAQSFGGDSRPNQRHVPRSSTSSLLSLGHQHLSADNIKALTAGGALVDFGRLGGAACASSRNTCRRSLPMALTYSYSRYFIRTTSSSEYIQYTIPSFPRGLLQLQLEAR